MEKYLVLVDDKVDGFYEGDPAVGDTIQVGSIVLEVA